MAATWTTKSDVIEWDDKGAPVAISVEATRTDGTSVWTRKVDRVLLPIAVGRGANTEADVIASTMDLLKRRYEQVVAAEALAKDAAPPDGFDAKLAAALNEMEAARG